MYATFANICSRSRGLHLNTMSAVACESGDSIAYEAIERYAWAQDVEFQTGLASILATSSGVEAEDLTLRARCFYYSRKTSVAVNYTSYKKWRTRQLPPTVTASSPTLPPVSTTPSASSPSRSHVATKSASPAEASMDHTKDTSSSETSARPDYPTSFDDIVELIKTGKPIPGIKDIPNTILAGQGTQAKQGRRLKPWEKQHHPLDEGHRGPREQPE